MSRRILKHLETRVEHEFILVDGTGKVLRKVIDPVRAIAAEDWPAYSAKTFPKALAETQAQLDADTAPPKR